jgi:hypothetical protein
VGTRKANPARRSAQDWASLVEEWRGSGLGLGEFATLRGVKARTLSWWRWRLATRGSSPLAPLRLVPLQVEPAADAAREELSWEIVTAGGDVLRVRGAIDGHDLATVLAALKLGRGRR